VIAVKCGKPAQEIPKWIEGHSRALLAFDAPLGWPIALAPALKRHRAGQPIVGRADELFHRYTDDAVKSRLALRQPPMEVGANLIARTALATLAELEELRKKLGARLTWSPVWTKGVRAIEVYPTATRRSLGVLGGGGNLSGLQDWYELAEGVRPKSPDECDAVVCAIAGLEFLRHRALAPRRGEADRARREGWIWVGPMAV
jgi:hypothetical protein